jgi:hypothetical protein
VCGLGPVGTSLIFGLVRGAGAFAPVLPTFVFVSRMQLAERYCGNGYHQFGSTVLSRLYQGVNMLLRSHNNTRLLTCHSVRR